MICEKPVQWLKNLLLVFLFCAGGVYLVVQIFSGGSLDEDVQSFGTVWETDFHNLAKVMHGVCANIILLFTDTHALLYFFFCCRFDNGFDKFWVSVNGDVVHRGLLCCTFLQLSLLVDGLLFVHSAWQK